MMRKHNNNNKKQGAGCPSSVNQSDITNTRRTQFSASSHTRDKSTHTVRSRSSNSFESNININQFDIVYDDDYILM
jgi:hypothetical protein